MSRNFHQIRKEYLLRELNENLLHPDPLLQIGIWIDEAISSDVSEPTAMNLATSSPEGKPSSRILLLKEITSKGLIFYSNYVSKKGIQLKNNPFAAITFFWPELERQIRLEGLAEKISDLESDKYFGSRPLESKIGTWASAQSAPLLSRKDLEEKFSALRNKFANSTIPRPHFWGGYLFTPTMVELWQGRASRLHDRIAYNIGSSGWEITRLSP